MEMQALLDSRPKGVSLDEGLKMYTDNGWTIEGVNEPKPSTIQKLGSELKQRGSDLATAVTTVGKGMTEAKTLPEVGKVIGRGLLRSGGAVAGSVLDTLGAGVELADKATGEVASTALKAGGEAFLTTETGKKALSALQAGNESYQAYKVSNPEGAKDLEAIMDIANVVPAVKAAGAVGKGAVKVAEIGGKGVLKVADATAQGGKKTFNVLKEGVSPTPTPTKALGEVAIAKTTEQLPVFEKALSSIDTSKVKTFEDLNNSFKKAIPTLSKQVDDELLKDTNLYKIEDLLVGQKTKAGNEIKTDYITRSIDGLEDLYTKLGDDVSKADIVDLRAKALNQGLTRKEVNDLARTYNTEYGSKAFTATGDIKSGFSAELYESTRKGLKDIARAGMGGNEAKAFDEALSSIYEAQKLTKKNADAVNAIKQRIEEQGWIGKGIRTVFNTSDLVTGGAVRALRDTVMARGSAQKLQNVLELENKLQKNLEVLQRAAKAKTEAATEKILQSLSKKYK